MDIVKYNLRNSGSIESIVNYRNNKKNVDDLENKALYISDCFNRRLVNRAIELYGKPSLIILDVEGSILLNDIPMYFIPYMDMGCLNWVNYLERANLPINPPTLYCFNFSINKKTMDRYLLLKLVEWFNLTNYKYTWSGIGSNADLTEIISEMDSVSASFIDDDFRNYILAPIQLKPLWFEEKSTLPILGKVSEYSSNVPVFSPLDRWDQFCGTLTLQSATTLITESATDMELNYTFSEKTVFAIMGLTFPIWVGNYGQAQQAETMGFDIFADVINHNYQYKKTLIERCYYAIADNLEILTNFEFAQHIRATNLQRLINNRTYLMNGGFLSWTNKQISNLRKETGVDVSCLNLRR